VSILGVATASADGSTATPGALTLSAIVPSGAELAVVFVRWASLADDAELIGLASSFGDVTIIHSTNKSGPSIALAYVEVEDIGSEHTLTPVLSSAPLSRFVVGVVFLDQIDLSNEAAWLRDWDYELEPRYALPDTPYVTAVDSAESDIVLAASTYWWDPAPDPPLNTTTLIAPFGGDANDQRVVIVDEPGSPTTEVYQYGPGNNLLPVLSIMPTAGGGETELVIADAVHGHAAVGVGLTQASALTMASSVHGHASGAVALTQASTLDVGGSAHGHVVDNIALAQAIALAVADSVHAQLSDGPALSQAYALQIGDGIHAHVAEALELSQAHILAIASSAHGHAEDSIELVQASILTIGDAVHTLVSAEVLLSQSVSLAIGDAVHAVLADGLTLSHGAVLAIASAIHLQAVDAIALTQATTIVVSDSVHAHIARQINLLMPGGPAVPPGRTIVVQARSRVIVIRPESRTIKVH